MNVLLAESVLIPVLMACPPLAACCWLLWRALGLPRRAAGAEAKRFRRHRTGMWIGSGAAVSAVIAAILVFRPRPPGDDLVEVLVVRKDLPIDTLLDESAVRSHIGRGSVRRDRLPAGAVGDEQLVLGKWTNRALRAGECLSDADVGHPIHDFIPAAHRMCYVQLGPDDRTADTFRPGARLDLFVGVPVAGGRVTSEPVLTGLLVLAVDPADRVLTVAVTPGEAEAIRAAEYRGDLRVVRSAPAE